MPLDKSIKKTLVIGSGPIVIGQAAEFDYAGTQACRVLRGEGVEIVLVNSNPATIMTDSASADRVYIEPLTLATVKRIIEKERPDSILSALGGQTGLTLCMQLAKDGFLDKMNVRLLGSSPEVIDKAEDRQLFKDTMQDIGQPVVPSVTARDARAALDFAAAIGYPVIVRPAFTLGGAGGGMAGNEGELRTIAANGLSLSPIGQILVEKSIAGWKEIEFEVMRDGAGNAIIVCSMENIDPVGVHTGDSIVAAPALTLSDAELQMLRDAALAIVEELGVEGGCNCQFALRPNSLDYAVIEVNPRVSRSSALASKATGYPIAKVATKVALGYRLSEITNPFTGVSYAASEPVIDYIAVKFPKWPFDKFVYAKRELGTQMKATGEVMSLSDTFESALLKAVRGAELGLETLDLPKLKSKSDGEIRALLSGQTDERLFVVYEALKRGINASDIYAATMIDPWFLGKIRNLITYERPECPPVYKSVDTGAGESSALTQYFYSVEDGAESVPSVIEKSGKERVIVLGSGPIRIGQGIEFDYACVHCVKALEKIGYETVVINNNPETVSTDFDTADRLYFEPLTEYDVMNIVNREKPLGVIAAFGGGTAIKLTQKLAANGVRIIGTPADSIDICEDRERFDALLEKLRIKRPKGFGVTSLEKALDAAETLGYPVLMRPSYVLGGQNMIIAYSDEDIREYMEIILDAGQDNPVLIDKYLSGLEIEVDAICDGSDMLIPGIMEHIERTGVHSGDSIAVYPAPHIDDELADEIYNITREICAALDVRGLVNLQYVISDGEVFVIEVNPRASRTVPYISKVTGIPMCELATRVSLGEKLKALGYRPGIAEIPPYTAVKVPVFSFEKLTDVDTHLGPEMKSTGETLGLGKNLSEALYKGLIAAGYRMNKKGGVFITVRDGDKGEIADIAKKFVTLGFSIYATKGTAGAIGAFDSDCGRRTEGLAHGGNTVTVVDRLNPDGTGEIMDLLGSGEISYIISTSAKGRDPARDSVKIRRKACALSIPCLTSLDTASALASSLLSRYSEINTELVDINNMRTKRLELKFTKMHTCGNDYIYIDCLDKEINSPESLSVFLADRHFGVGGDGVVLILPPTKPDADARMRMFNLDGSEGRMCGNAIRCVAKYLYDNGIVPRLRMRVETLSGTKELFLKTRNAQVYSVKANLGYAELSPEKIPVALEGERVIDRPVVIGGAEYRATCLSMGNPHAVVFTEDVDGLDLSEIGPAFEYDPLFPDRVNAEFVKVIGPNRLKARVWERGSGETLACGTGACAAAVAAVLNGRCDKGADITVLLPGGELTVNYTDGAVYLTGGCEKVYDGVTLI